MVHPGGDVPQGDAKTAEPHLYRIWRTMCATTSAGEQSHSFRSITPLPSVGGPKFGQISLRSGTQNPRVRRYHCFNQGSLRS